MKDTLLGSCGARLSLPRTRSDSGFQIGVDWTSSKQTSLIRRSQVVIGLSRQLPDCYEGHDLTLIAELTASDADVIQQLSNFYRKNGQRARLSADAGGSILAKLEVAEKALSG